MTRIHIEQGDITTYATDAIVNAANNDLILGGGLASAIAAKGGPEIQQQCHRIGSIPLGQAAITTAGMLPARFVIHQASMSLGHPTTAEALRNSTRATLQLAEDNNLRTIALPAVGTGIGGLDVGACAEIMLQVAHSHATAKAAKLQDIYFVLYDKRTFDVFQSMYSSFTMTQ